MYCFPPRKQVHPRDSEKSIALFAHVSVVMHPSRPSSFQPPAALLSPTYKLLSKWGFDTCRKFPPPTSPEINICLLGTFKSKASFSRSFPPCCILGKTKVAEIIIAEAPLFLHAGREEAAAVPFRTHLQVFTLQSREKSFSGGRSSSSLFRGTN